MGGEGSNCTGGRDTGDAAFRGIARVQSRLAQLAPVISTCTAKQAASACDGPVPTMIARTPYAKERWHSPTRSREIRLQPPPESPDHWESGVFEIALPYQGDAFRVVYAVQPGEEIWVVHVFQKKSTQGIKTPKRELDLIRDRLKRLKECCDAR